MQSQLFRFAPTDKAPIETSIDAHTDIYLQAAKSKIIDQVKTIVRAYEIECNKMRGTVATRISFSVPMVTDMAHDVFLRLLPDDLYCEARDNRVQATTDFEIVRKFSWSM